MSTRKIVLSIGQKVTNQELLLKLRKIDNRYSYYGLTEFGIEYNIDDKYIRYILDPASNQSILPTLEESNKNMIIRHELTTNQNEYKFKIPENSMNLTLLYFVDPPEVDTVVPEAYHKRGYSRRTNEESRILNRPAANYIMAKCYSNIDNITGYVYLPLSLLKEL